MDGGESLSVEETNKLRIAAGLKPLRIEPEEAAEDSPEHNFAKRRKQDADERKRKEIMKKIAKARNRHELDRKLAGKGLADADGDTAMDAKAWLKQSKKKQKELAARKAIELESLDQLYQEEYTANDLSGLRVGHDVNDFIEGKDQILTLKDANILDDGEEDELINVNMVDEDKRRKNMKNKKKKAAYDVYDDDQYASGKKKSLLSQYDDDDEQSSFLLSNGGISDRTSHRPADVTEHNKTAIDLAYLKNQEINDYLLPEEVSFKKKKKKKSSKAGRTRVADAEVGEEGELLVDAAPAQIQRQNLDDANLVDDDDLQLAIARTRRLKARQQTQLRPEDIAEEMKQRQFQKMDAEEEEPEEGGLVIDDTSEFVRGLNFDAEVDADLVTNGKINGTSRSIKEETPEDKPSVEEGVSNGKAAKTEMEDVEEDDGDILEGMRMEEDDIRTPLASTEEPLVQKGMAATLALLKQQGLSIRPSDEQLERERVQKERAQWIVEQRRRDLEKDAEKRRIRQEAAAANTGSSKGRQQQQQQQQQYKDHSAEIREAQESWDKFKDYKPDVNISYVDEFGRNMTEKEAWKDLSHKFHGKGQGKGKTEKRLRKIEEERKLEKKLAEQSVVGAMTALSNRQAQTGKAGMVIERGKRAVVPEFIGLAKDTDKESKGKRRKLDKNDD